MKENRIDEGKLSDRGQGLGTATYEMVIKRAREIAITNGRSAQNVLDSDIEQALEEFEGKDEINPQPSAEESIPEDQRWEPVPTSEGTQAPTYPASDEQTVAERLVDEGVADAEHDQEIKATREAWRRDREG